MAKHDQMPKYHELMNPLLKSLHEFGGSGSIEEILSQVSDSLGLSEDVLSIPHNPDKSSQTELEYRLAWARTYLKKYGIIDNSERGVWVIVPEERGVTSVKPQDVVKAVPTWPEKSVKGSNGQRLKPKTTFLKKPKRGKVGSIMFSLKSCLQTHLNVWSNVY